eukprot:7651127-Pyramimonas_sp.AAC.1
MFALLIFNHHRAYFLHRRYRSSFSFPPRTCRACSGSAPKATISPLPRPRPVAVHHHVPSWRRARMRARRYSHPNWPDLDIRT